MYMGAAPMVNPTGLQTRPAAAFVNKLEEYASKIVVLKGERRDGVMSLLGPMKVGRSQGDRMVNRAEGPDEGGRA